jgi:hypothetical protein
MRKISKTRTSGLDRNRMDTDLGDTRPLRIPGATITSRPDSLAIDLDNLFARPATGPTVAGAVSAGATQAKHPPADRPNKGTVSLSDGTRITFANAGQFDIVESV